MKRPLCICIAVFLIVLGLWLYCVWHVNRSYPQIPQVSYQIGDWVSFDGCKITEASKLDGYEIRVTDRKMTETDSFLAQYASDEEIVQYKKQCTDGYIRKPDGVYIVCLTLRNSSDAGDDSKGIDWTPMYLYDKDKVLSLDSNLYGYANRVADGSTRLSLRPGTEMEFILPYGIYYDLAGEAADRAENINWKLLLCLWPEMKTVYLG